MTIISIIILAASMAAGGPVVPVVGFPDHSDPPASSVPAEPDRPTRLVSGVATWYATGPGAGHAAAGPALRRALGKDWRGRTVSVRNGSGTSVEVRVTDWCRCPDNRVIDLSKQDFSTLAPLSRGVINVSIEEIK